MEEYGNFGPLIDGGIEKQDAPPLVGKVNDGRIRLIKRNYPRTDTWIQMLKKTKKNEDILFIDPIIPHLTNF